MTTYKLSDVKTQSQLLSKQLMFEDIAKAYKSMYKRVERFYGLNNKYLSNGQLRNK